MSIGYRSVMRLDDTTDAVHVAETELSSWLRSKRQNGVEVSEWGGAGEHQLGAAARLTVVHAEEGRDETRRRLYRLVEETDAGKWTASVYALDAPNAPQSQRQTIVVEVSTDASDTRSAVTKTGTPRLVKNILHAHRAHDGAAILTGAPQFIRGDQAEDILAAIMDPTRTASVIVAPDPGSERPDRWQAVVTNLTTESIGVASSFVTDAEATRILNEQLPTSHKVSSGVIRTYSPRVDLSNPDDSRRHLMLFPDTLARSLYGNPPLRVARPLVIRHAESTRLRFIERELPADVRRGIDLLRRAESSQRRASAVEQTRVNAEVEIRKSWEADAFSESLLKDRLVAARDILRRFGGLREDRKDPATEASEKEAIASLGAQLEAKTADVALLETQLEEMLAENEKLQREMEDMRSQFEELDIATTIAEDEARDAQRSASYFKQELAQLQRFDIVVPSMEEIWREPDDLEELLERITPGTKTHQAITRVVFTGDPRKTLEIEKRGYGMRYAHAFWDYIHVLYDYAEGRATGRVNCDMRGYLTTDHIAGHKCPEPRHSHNESTTTLGNWGDERVFPVPREVDPSGKILMAAHFRPTWADMFAPRMHYYDDTDNTGKVYVGYIGRHLKNTKT